MHEIIQDLGSIPSSSMSENYIYYFYGRQRIQTEKLFQ